MDQSDWLLDNNNHVAKLTHSLQTCLCVANEKLFLDTSRLPKDVKYLPEGKPTGINRINRGMGRHTRKFRLKQD